MNNKFEWNRFCKVVAKDFNNLWPLFGTTMLVLSLLPVAIWLLLLAFDADTLMPANIRMWILYFIVYFGAIMSTSRIYHNCNLHNTGIGFAMLPASKAEKFMSMLLYSFIIVPVIMILGGGIVDTVLYMLPIGSYDEPIWNGSFMKMYDMFRTIEVSNATLLTFAMVLSFASSIACFFFTATLFKKHKVIYTFLWLFLIGLVLNLILIPVGIGIASSPSFTDWLNALVNYFKEFEPWQIINLMFYISLAWNLLLTAVFIWLAGLRLKKMAY